MVVTGFDWDHFRTEEVEEVFENPHRVRRSRASRYSAFGETLDGRLALVVDERQAHGRIRVVTVRDMNQ